MKDWSKTMRNRKISIEKVQQAFNAAIKRRDGMCMVRDYETCCGELECSHFFTTGASPALRFYPFNAWAQCHKHHWNHHNKDEPFYLTWISQNHLMQWQLMESLRHRYIKYTDELKAEIIHLCNEDKLEELKELVEGELK